MAKAYFSGCLFHFTRRVAGKLSGFFFLLISFVGHSQSFYYMAAQMEPAGKPRVDYHILLRIEADGSALGRVAYIDPATNQQRLVEQAFTDSVIHESSDRTSQHVLFPSATPVYLDESDTNGFLQQRILFQQKTEGSEVYDFPAGVLYDIGGGVWKSATLNKVEEKSFVQLQNEKDFTAIFYNPKDPLYSYLFDFNSRSLSKTEQNARLHLIVIANTNDQSIGTSSQKDLTKVVELFKGITSQAGIKFSPVTVSGAAFSKKRVEAEIAKVKPDKNDIVVFYYSGHGYRRETDKSDFQRMSLRTSDAQNLDANSLGIEEVYNRLLTKKAGFTLVLGDCCNETVIDPVARGREPLRSRSRGPLGYKLNTDNLKALFFPARPVSVLVGSAEKNQLAIGNPSLGGFFTNFFLTELTAALYGNQLKTWEAMLSAAKENTRKQSLTALCGKGRCTQRAVIKLSK